MGQTVILAVEAVAKVWSVADVFSEIIDVVGCSPDPSYRSVSVAYTACTLCDGDIRKDVELVGRPCDCAAAGTQQQALRLPASSPCNGIKGCIAGDCIVGLTQQAFLLLESLERR